MSTYPTNEMLGYFEGYSKYSKKQIKEIADLLRELSKKLASLSDDYEKSKRKDELSKGKNAFLILAVIVFFAYFFI